MHTATEIARHLVWLGYNPETPDEGFYFSPLRLQKLLYFCQGWSMALLGRPLFAEPMEAWVNGPVVRSVYKLFQGESNCIDPNHIGEPTELLSVAERDLMESVVERYAAKRTWELVRITHSESPWRQARNGLGEQEQSSNQLSNDLLQSTYEAKAKSTGKAEILNLRREWMDDPIEPGEPADAVFEQLLAKC